MANEALKSLGETAEGNTVLASLKRIETKIDTVIANQSGGTGSGTGGDTPPTE